MATLGTQTISTSYTQLLKTFGSNIVDGTMRAISSGDEAGVSALQISTTGAKSTGTFAVDGASTFGSHLTASTGTATIGTLSVSGQATFGSHVTMSTGTATIGTESVNTSTIGTLAVTNTATVGTLKVGASGPSLTAVTFATAAYTGGTVLDIDHATTGLNVSTGTLAASGVVLGDMVIGNINSIGSTTGATPAGLLQDFRVESAGVLRFTIFNSTQTTGTIPAGTIFATALRFTA